MLFARRDEEVILLGTMGCSSVLSIASIVLTIFYLLTLMKALQACSPATRTMEPGLVWLNLVPLVNLFWTFFTVAHIGNSLRREYLDRGLARGGSFGKPVGFTLYALHLLNLPVAVIGTGVVFLAAREDDPELAVAGTLGTLGVEVVMWMIQLVLFITYWVKVAGYTRRLNESGGRRERYEDRDGRDDRGEFDDDYRPRG